MPSSPLQGEAWFTNLFVRFSNPILGVLVGALVTGIIQSSSASVGILQAAERHRRHHLRQRHPHHHGSEYRYLRHRADFFCGRK